MYNSIISYWTPSCLNLHIINYLLLSPASIVGFEDMTKFKYLLNALKPTILFTNKLNSGNAGHHSFLNLLSPRLQLKT